MLASGKFNTLYHVIQILLPVKKVRFSLSVSHDFILLIIIITHVAKLKDGWFI